MPRERLRGGVDRLGNDFDPRNRHVPRQAVGAHQRDLFSGGDPYHGGAYYRNPGPPPGWDPRRDAPSHFVPYATLNPHQVRDVRGGDGPFRPTPQPGPAPRTDPDMSLYSSHHYRKLVPTD